MFLRTDTARSDFFLVSAVLLFGSLLTQLASGLIPNTTLAFWFQHLLVPVLLVITPFWLQHSRQQPLAALWQGSVKDLVIGAVVSLPVVLAIVAIQTTSGGLGLYFGTGMLFPALAKWVGIGVSLAFLVQRADIAFPGDLMAAREVSFRMASVMIGPGVVAGLGFVAKAILFDGDGIQGAMTEIGLAFLPVGAGLAWVLAERVVGLIANVNRNAWYTVGAILFLAEVNILAVITNLPAFAFDLMTVAPLGALALVMLSAWETHKSVRYGYGMALAFGLASVPGTAAFI